MRLKAGIAAGVLGLAMAGGTWAQETKTTTTTVERVTVTGPVIRYTPGQMIVVRGDDAREVTYRLGSVTVPPEVAVGKTVTIYAEPGSGDAVQVTRVMLAGPLDMSDADYVTVTGTVHAYEPGRSVTILRPDGSEVTYTVDTESTLPEKLVTGKTVTVKTTKVTTGTPVVKTITYTTTTKTSTRK